MRSAKPIMVAQILLISICSAVCADTPQEKINYRVGAVVSRDGSRIVQNVSIAPERFTREDLISLAKELQKRYSQRYNQILISIFDDQYAATQRPALLIEARERDYEVYQHEHASYIMKKGTGEDYLTLEPDLWNDSTHTRLQIQTDQTDDCAVQISQGRCLMIIAKHLRYPEEAWRNDEIGDLVLRVTVASNGLVTRAELVGEPSISQLLKNAALDDARSWRFEPGTVNAELNVTYRFRLTGSSDTFRREIVRYNLPKEVVITSNPAR